MSELMCHGESLSISGTAGKDANYRGLTARWPAGSTEVTNSLVNVTVSLWQVERHDRNAGPFGAARYVRDWGFWTDAKRFAGLGRQRLDLLLSQCVLVFVRARE